MARNRIDRHVESQRWSAARVGVSQGRAASHPEVHWLHQRQEHVHPLAAQPGARAVEGEFLHLLLIPRSRIHVE